MKLLQVLLAAFAIQNAVAAPLEATAAVSKVDDASHPKHNQGHATVPLAGPSRNQNHGGQRQQQQQQHQPQQHQQPQQPQQHQQPQHQGGQNHGGGRGKGKGFGGAGGPNGPGGMSGGAPTGQ
ncbi:hypothetical protein SPI_05659 [Niveomyces insectorum RCEF 264]|uniref:Uncharacterized protein n=1 Tax=Niveomyces insectorum RCEF 264 TaxID=1081102 RepID=A0A167TEY1_9HYPO|nr:hypothetical protein SPI_05659 [Niveomyces insectorum RCEF 264]